MDGVLNHASKGMTASVVRQFAPSRIERQLLAQVFELVCGQRSEGKDSRSGGRRSAPIPAEGNGVPTAQGHVAGRHVA